MKPTVSVLIPAYNHEQYVGAAIESVLNQTYENFELLISDDCSTDDTRRVISGYSDARIKTFFFEKNHGTVNALNTLLNSAKGEYVAILGSDDIWLPDKLERQLDVMSNMPDIAACFTRAEIIDGETRIIEKCDTSPMDIFDWKNDEKAKMLCGIFLTGNHFCHSSALIRTSAHKEIGEYKPQYRQLHDFDLWVRVLLKYPVWIIEDKLVKYRVVASAKNVSENIKENNIRLFNEAKYIFSDMFKNISDSDFINGFGSYFVNKGACSSAQLKCEKFFILWDKSLWQHECRSLALDYLMNNLSDLDFCECLEKEYDFSVENLYEATGCFVTHCPMDFSDEVALKHELDSIYNSKPWKLICRLKKAKEFFRRNM